MEVKKYSRTISYTHAWLHGMLQNVLIYGMPETGLAIKWRLQDRLISYPCQKLAETFVQTILCFDIYPNNKHSF